MTTNFKNGGNHVNQPSLAKHIQRGRVWNAIALFLIAFVLVIVPVAGSAGVPPASALPSPIFAIADVPGGTPATATETVALPTPSPEFIVKLATDHHWITTILLIVGALRMLFKPLMMVLEWYVKQTSDPNDDRKLEQFEAGPIYKFVSHALDIVASVKLPTIKKLAQDP
jgi:hypothetical protein